MKIVKSLKIAGNTVKIVSESVVLDLHDPGRAIFMVISSENVLPGDRVEFDIGLNGSAERYFSGYVSGAKRIDAKQVRIYARDVFALLENRCPIAQRNTTARRILEEISGRFGIAFQIGRKNMAKFEQPIAHFFNPGSAVAALNMIGRHLEFNDYLCRCQADGTVFVGSGDELLGSDSTLLFPPQFFTELSAAGASCPCVPALRPGRKIRIGELEIARIEQTNIAGEKMRLTFEGGLC